MKKNEFFMSRCFQIARRFRGNTKTNPLVGALLEFEGKIIGEGAHEKFGKAHAEVNAINNVAEEFVDKIPQSTLYVTLEPCFHVGKTPPCVNLILEKKIPRVVISCIDPNPKVAGKSINLLRESGVEVVVGVLEKEGNALITPFLTNIEQKRPYIIVKFAESEDHFIGKENEAVWLTNSFSKHLVHKWRNETDAILVGKNTALIDNPQLTNRLYFGKNPIRVLIDRNIEVSKDFFICDNSTETIIFNDVLNEKKGNLFFEKINFDNNPLEQILNSLFVKNIGSLIVEGGAFTINSFIEKGYCDEIRVFLTKKVLKYGVLSPNIGNFEKKVSYQIDDNFLFIYLNSKKNITKHQI